MTEISILEIWIHKKKCTAKQFRRLKFLGIIEIPLLSEHILSALLKEIFGGLYSLQDSWQHCWEQTVCRQVWNENILRYSRQEVLVSSKREVVFVVNMVYAKHYTTRIKTYTFIQSWIQTGRQMLCYFSYINFKNLKIIFLKGTVSIWITWV